MGLAGDWLNEPGKRAARSGWSGGEQDRWRPCDLRSCRTARWRRNLGTAFRYAGPAVLSRPDKGTLRSAPEARLSPQRASPGIPDKFAPARYRTKAPMSEVAGSGHIMKAREGGRG